MTALKIDFLKLTDFEISMLIIERDSSQFKVERIDELLNKVGQAKGFTEATKISSPKQDGLPGTDDLSKLPWKSYATKESAKPEEAAWLFANTPGTEVLLAELKTRDKVQINSFEFTLSGRKKQFISRKTVKP